MKKLPVGLELEATGMTGDRRKAFSRGTGGPSPACGKGTGRASPGFPSGSATALLDDPVQVTDLFELLSLNLPSQLPMGSGAALPSLPAH